MGWSSDEEQERQQRETLAAEYAEGFEQLARIERLWIDQVSPLGPVSTERQVQALLPRVAELLELTYGAALVHPSERPLRPLLEQCPQISGEWELDTAALTLELVGSTLVLPLLPLPRGGDALSTDDAIGDGVRSRRRFGLLTHVRLSQPPSPSSPLDDLGVMLLDGEAFASAEHRMRLDLAALADAVRTHLIDALPSATVLTRTGTSEHGRIATSLLPDCDVDAARSADRLVDLFAGLEHALARGIAGGRGPDAATVTDREVTHRKDMLLESIDRICVTVHQALPEGTVEPVRLTFRATTGEDPDGFGVLPLAYDLQLDLTEAHRGEGLLEVSSWTGRAERAVLLPHVADLWTDHIDSALRRANAIVPGIRRSLHDETMEPVVEVGPPGRVFDPERWVDAEVPF